jgi:hypothetical protein
LQVCIRMVCNLIARPYRRTSSRVMVFVHIQYRINE